MKIDKEVVEKLICNLDETKIEIGNIFDDCIDKIEDADDVEEIMKLKQDLLCNIVKNMPLNPCDCYFCILYDYNNNFSELKVCKNCEYGKIHGTCSTGSNGNDFQKIIEQKDLLEEVIIDHYFNDDEYIETRKMKRKKLKKHKDC